MKKNECDVEGEVLVVLYRKPNGRLGFSFRGRAADECARRLGKPGSILDLPVQLVVEILTEQWPG